MNMTAVGLIRAMIAEYVLRTRQAGNTVYTAGMGAMITHAVMVAYGEDLETASERAGDMITDVMCGMD